MSGFSDRFAEVGTEIAVDASASGDGVNLFHPTSEAELTYEEELTQLHQWTQSGKESIAHLVLTGHLKNSHFRSVIWQILLDILPHQQNRWVKELRRRRNFYRRQRDILLSDPRLAPENDHPLSEDSSSAWHQYFCDKELRATIRKDVVRTSPDDKFFSSESIQNTMVNILFLYAREHQEICYRQGMHEILAPLLLVLHADQQALLEAKKDISVQGPILEVLDHTCLEEDTYWLLESIMKHLACTYIIPVKPTSTGEIPSRSPKNTELESEVCSRMRRIRDDVLEKWDPQLRQHLVNLDIPLYFGIRWLRVMFGQEFVKSSLLVLWDAIFAANNNFGLVDHIVVAMLMMIRNRLLEEDFYGCLDLLVHYPADIQVHNVFRLALHMLKPEEFPRPGDISGSPKPAVGPRSSISGRIRKLMSRPPKGDSALSPTSIPSKKLSLMFRGSRPEEVGTNYLEHYPQFPSRNSEDPTELLTTLQNKVFLTSLRLAKYQLTLEQHLSTSGAPTSVLCAVEGVKEIAAMLEELGGPQNKVETAIEATQSPIISASNSPDPIIVSSVDSTFASSVPNKSQITSLHPVSSTSPKSTGVKNLFEMKNISMSVISTSKFVLSNPLRNMYGSLDYEPERETFTYLDYQRSLGEGRIFARIKR